MTLKENLLTQIQSMLTVKSQYDQKFENRKTLLSLLLILCSQPYQINSDNVTDSDTTSAHGSSEPVLNCPCSFLKVTKLCTY